MYITQHTQCGSAHTRSGIQNQDRIQAVGDKRYTVIALTDGVSTCSAAAEGSEITCSTVSDTLLHYAGRLFRMKQEQASTAILNRVLENLRQRARTDGADVQAYASTLAAVLFDRKDNTLLTVNLGDGLIMASGHGRCSVIGPPADSSDGCVTTVTYDAEHELQFRIMPADCIESIAIFSDGAWKPLYCGCSLNPEVKDMILAHDYPALSQHLSGITPEDDNSFISMCIRT